MVNPYAKHHGHSGVMGPIEHGSRVGEQVLEHVGHDVKMAEHHQQANIPNITRRFNR